jgi:glycosyltransferase involved in cell wall biosynthesis
MASHKQGNRKNKIIVVTNATAVGGTEKHLNQLILRLPLSEVDATILCYGLDPYSDFLKGTHNLAVRIKSGLKRGGMFSYWMAFIRHRPDAMLFVNADLGWFPWYAYLAARLSGARRIVAIEQLIAAAPEHGTGGPVDATHEPLARKVRRWLGWRARHLRRPEFICDKTICVSNAVRERLIQDYQYPAEKAVVIFNGVDLTQYGVKSDAEGLRRTLKIGTHEDVLVCVTRFDRAKGVDVLLQAMAIIAPQQPARCIIVGTGKLESELRCLSEKLGLSKSVMFVGYASDVRPYLQTGDIFVLPSRREGLPLALLEAMACGMPCVVTDAGGNREAISHGRSGLVVRPDSAAELADAITHLFRNKEERRRLGANARQRVEQEFNTEESMAKIAAILLGESVGHALENLDSVLAGTPRSSA